jgi:hypothetical protein
VIESDGKTDNAQHVLALDPFTLAALRAHVAMLDGERKEFGPDYEDHGVLFCWENGRPLHPDTITRRFKRLAAAAGIPEIDHSRPSAQLRQGSAGMRRSTGRRSAGGSATPMSHSP